MYAASLVLLGLFIALNVLAYRHAYTMTHFTATGPQRRSPSRDGPERLDWSQKAAVLLGGVEIGRPRSEQTPADVGLEYEARTIAGAVGALDAWYLPHPDGRGVVCLFHGYAACKANLLAEARAFHDLGYACLLVDFPGSGGSAGDATTIGFREGDDVARVVGYAREQWPDARVILFGQSMGAVATLRAMSDLGVKADAVILESPFDRLINAVGARFSALGVPTFPGAALMVFWGGWQHGYNGFTHNPVEYAKAVGGPVLLMRGRDDVRVGADQVEAIYANLQGPKALHAFDGVGHNSCAAERPEEWKECVGRFLEHNAAASVRAPAGIGDDVHP
jgi:alpha-beta hydrolase superfamily lysophospholipase